MIKKPKDEMIHHALMTAIDYLIGDNVEMVRSPEVAKMAMASLLSQSDSFNAKKLSIEALAARARPLIRLHEKENTPDLASSMEQITLFEKELPDYASIPRVIDGRKENVYVNRTFMTYAERIALGAKMTRIGGSFVKRGALIVAEAEELVDQGLLEKESDAG